MKLGTMLQDSQTDIAQGTSAGGTHQQGEPISRILNKRKFYPQLKVVF